VGGLFYPIKNTKLYLKMEILTEQSKRQGYIFIGHIFAIVQLFCHQQDKTKIRQFHL